MLTLRKFDSLAEGTRHRKTPLLLREFEHGLSEGIEIDRGYLNGLLGRIAADRYWPAEVRTSAAEMASGSAEGRLSVHSLNSLRHAVLEQLGRHWADWDAEMPGDRTLSVTEGAADRGDDRLMPVRAYLDGIRSPFNVGSIMRTALAFGTERVWCSPGTASPRHPRALRSAMGAEDILRWETGSLENLSRQDTGVIFALELGGIPLEVFRFPSSGTIVLGSEELGVSPEVLKLAENDGGLVSITLPGPKASLNVGVAFGIVLRQWILSL